MPFVFGYGSLVDRTSIAVTLGRELGADEAPQPATLRGFRRAWNVASHSSGRPEYRLTTEDGAPWSGWLGFLGLEETAEGATIGAVFEIASEELGLFDHRERRYDRVEVTHAIDLWGGRHLQGRLYTYVPKADVVSMARREGAAVTVMARYLRLVDHAYRQLGAEPYEAHVSSLPDPAPFGVREIIAEPIDPDQVNQAVDPK